MRPKNCCPLYARLSWEEIALCVTADATCGSSNAQRACNIRYQRRPACTLRLTILVLEEAYGALGVRCRSPDVSGTFAEKIHPGLPIMAAWWTGRISTGGFLSDGKVLGEKRTLNHCIWNQRWWHMLPACNQVGCGKEIFGPILPILTYRDMAGAISIIRQRPNLAFYVFTSKTKGGGRLAGAAPAGGACVNNVGTWPIMSLPFFGGRGNSGIGSYRWNSGSTVLATWRRWCRHPPGLISVKHPHSQGKLGLFKWLIRCLLQHLGDQVCLSCHP